LKKSVDDKKLWEYLFSDEYSEEDEIRTIINKFLMKPEKIQEVQKL